MQIVWPFHELKPEVVKVDEKKINTVSIQNRSARKI